jgi:hypothetical protein
MFLDMKAESGQSPQTTYVYPVTYPEEFIQLDKKLREENL